MAVIGKSARRPGATTTVTPAVQQTAGQKSALSLIKAQPTANLTRLRVTSQDMADPAKAASVISRLQDAIDQSTIGSRTSPLNGGGTLIKSIAFVNGTPQLVQHALGRAPIGYFVTRAQSVTAGSAAAYGTLFNETSDAQTVSLPSASTFVQSPQNHAGSSSGTTLTTGASGKITINTAGAYEVTFSASVKLSSATTNTSAAIYINGVQQPDLIARSQGGFTSAIYTLPISGVHVFSAGDVVDVRYASVGTTITLTIDSSNLSVAAAGSSPAIDVYETALPTGADATQYLNLIPLATMTADLFVF